MRKIFYLILSLFFLQLYGCTKKENKATEFETIDYSKIRGFNYTPANVTAPRHHIEAWMKYNEAVTNFDLDLAARLKLNQVRVFIPYQVYTESVDKQVLKAKLKHFVRACFKRGIGVMPVVGSGEWRNDTTLRPKAEEWARFLVETLSDEPNLQMWDVSNEPDNLKYSEEQKMQNFENCKYMSKPFHNLDHKTPVTIGMNFISGTMALADYVDVLQFHDYSRTREGIRENISRIKEFAAEVGKPLIDGEIGCIARANPYDVTLEEHMNAGVGWYIWELMIVRGGWGNVHGVFYEDGTVRDPSIAAAIMGWFRNRDKNILLSVPDREGTVTNVVNRINTWQSNTEATWEEGLKLTEIAANLLESAQLVAMRIPPSLEVARLCEGEANIPALKKLLTEYVEILKPLMIAKK